MAAGTLLAGELLAGELLTGTLLAGSVTSDAALLLGAAAWLPGFIAFIAGKAAVGRFAGNSPPGLVVGNAGSGLSGKANNVSGTDIPALAGKGLGRAAVLLDAASLAAMSPAAGNADKASPAGRALLPANGGAAMLDGGTLIAVEAGS